MKTAKSIVALATSWLGKNQNDGSHKMIIDIYNTQTPLPRNYKVRYHDYWCATFITALAVKLGYTDIIPCECSCNEMIKLAVKKGIWKEDESICPKVGYIILYDWEDNGVGDNKGVPNHVGIVSNVDTDKRTFTVIEGNYNGAVRRRFLQFNNKFIRGYITPKYDEIPEREPTKRTLREYLSICSTVIDGEMGTGEQRKSNLKKLGFDPDKVQRIINALYS